jgi:hypothetical protein
MTEIEAPVLAPAEASVAMAADGAPARRATKFMAELSRAMQAAAEHSRNETMARFEIDAKTVVEELHATATEEVAALRRQADDDVAAIREWSKAEIARVREETEARVAGRKTGLDAEMEANAVTVETRAQRIAVVVAAFEADMTAFFERLNAEEDPTRIATMAETMPDPPSLQDVLAGMVAEAPSMAPTPAPDLSRGTPATTGAEIDFAAAEAEAASFSGDLGTLGDEDDETAAATDTAAGSASIGAETPLAVAPLTPDHTASTRVLVGGLVSVASIANFKRSLTRIDGVSSIAVASGPDGEFIFTVGHDAGLALGPAILTLSGFDSKITSESDVEIQISAQDRDAAG